MAKGRRRQLSTNDGQLLNVGNKWFSLNIVKMRINKLKEGFTILISLEEAAALEIKKIVRVAKGWKCFK